MGAPVPRMSSPNHLQVQGSEVSFAVPPSLHERLVDMNLDALNLLWEGQAGSAVALFQEAIRLILSNQADGTANNRTAHNCPRSVQVPVSLSALELLGGVLGEDSDEPVEHDSFSFYRHLFSIEYANDDNGQDQVSAQNMPFVLQDWDLPSLGALFLYNLGVVHLETGVNQRNFSALSQAVTLFRSALSLLLSSPPEGALSVEKVHLLMALYTNLGHAASFLNDGITLQVCYNGLDGFLRQVSAWLPLGISDMPEWADFFRQSIARARSSHLHIATAA